MELMFVLDHFSQKNRIMTRNGEIHVRNIIIQCEGSELIFA